MSKERLTTAAELLRKGGTLIEEPCSACKGVQVKYAGKIVCVSCGREITEAPQPKEEAAAESKAEAPAEVIGELRKTVTAKISELLPILRSERDLEKQRELTKLLIGYLEILEKIPS